LYIHYVRDFFVIRRREATQIEVNYDFNILAPLKDKKL